jgi:hypothetical protein
MRSSTARTLLGSASASRIAWRKSAGIGKKRKKRKASWRAYIRRGAAAKAANNGGEIIKMVKTEKSESGEKALARVEA